MRTTTTCPACEQPVSLWRIMSAPTPVHLYCPSCKTRIRPKGWTIPSIIFAVVMGLVIGFILSHLYRDDQISAVVAISIAVGSILLLELGWCLFICNKATLIARSE